MAFGITDGDLLRLQAHENNDQMLNRLRCMSLVGASLRIEVRCEQSSMQTGLQSADRGGDGQTPRRRAHVYLSRSK